MQHGDRIGMWQWVGQMQDAGHVAHVVTCPITLDIIMTPSLASELKRLLKVVGRAVEPSVEVLFGALAAACVRGGSLDLISERFRVLLHLGAPARSLRPPMTP